MHPPPPPAPSITDTPEDRALKAKHAAMWASGSYRTVVDDVVAPLGGILVDVVDVQPGQRVLDVAAGTGTSALPAARRGAEVIATDLTPELLDVGRAAAAAEGLQLTLGDRRRRGVALRRRRVRRRAVRHRRHVRPAPPAGGRRARPGLPAGRDHRRPELDAGGLHRAAVRHHEAVRAAASSGSLAGPAVGSGRSRPRSVRGPGHRSGRAPADAAGRPLRRPGRSSATSSRPTTARRSRCTASSPTTPRRSTPWTPTSPPWVTGSSATGSWAGSTCS